tara:strand:+ start:46 stop:189 length:144 start_codon:yes stop_codon:yes gene_type:complete
MNLEKVLKVIKKIESKLEKQGNITDARLENHLDNLQQLAIELTFKKE